MKKLFVKMGIVILASATILPLSACTFNFYVERATNAIAKSFANQTSALIKSLVISKELHADTSSTNDDIMNKVTNSSITNSTKNSDLKNWQELQEKWGYGSTPTINAEGGFIPNDFFVASGTGSLTKNIKNRKNVNNIFEKANFITLLPITKNSTLVNTFLSDDISKTIINFLTNLQDDKEHKNILTNLINNYDINFLQPLQQVFNNLVKGQWSEEQTTTPKDLDDFKKYMNNWKDEAGTPYSQWTTENKWNFDPSFLITYRKVDTWNKSDYNLYRSGVLLNHLFLEISRDYNINKPTTNKTAKGEKAKPRYLGDIFGDYIFQKKGSWTPDPDFDDKGFVADIEQYVPYLISNPRYILQIVEAILPILKDIILKIPVQAPGLTKLTLGSIANDINKGEYNLLDILNKIKTLLDDPVTLKALLKQLMGRSDELSTLLYDIKFNFEYIFKISLSLGGTIYSGKLDSQLDRIIELLLNFITKPAVKNTIDSTINILEQVDKQYQDNTGINIDLVKLQSFLLDNKEGLLIIFHNTIDQLKKMINPGYEIKHSDIEKLYESLGGRINPNEDFTEGSVIDRLQNALNDDNPIDNPFINIVNLIFGTTGDDAKIGISRVITNENNDWIAKNYEAYFDSSSKGINTKIGHTYNFKMNKQRMGANETINLTYNFDYKINNKTYHFIITVINEENLDNFDGIRNFKFKTINLTSIQ